MKKIILNTFLLIAITVNSQTIIPLESYDGTREPNSYYQDINNVLDPFIGTWEFTEGSTIFRIVLNKASMAEVPNTEVPYFEDILYGEYKYVQNNVVMINTLNNVYPLGTIFFKRTINGNSILNHYDYPLCGDCDSTEKRVQLNCYDPLKEVYYKLTLRHKVIGSVNQLFGYLETDGVKFTISDPDDIETYDIEVVGSTIPINQYIFRKL